jgi:Trypsin
MHIPFSNEHISSDAGFDRRPATRLASPSTVLCMLAPLLGACDRGASPDAGEAPTAPQPPAPAPAPPPVDGTDPVGKVQQAIGNGSNDTGGAFPAVGYVRFFHADGKVSACTGFLISPLWVATANHCVTGVSNPPTWASIEVTDADLQVDAEIEFALRPTLAPGTFTFRHTFANSGPIQVRMRRNVKSSSSDDSARDIALFRLDRMVPTALGATIDPLAATISPRRRSATAPSTSSSPRATI